MIYLLDKEAQF